MGRRPRGRRPSFVLTQTGTPRPTLGVNGRERRVSGCGSCGASVAPRQKFCGECGSALTSACSGCGASATPGQRFCVECGGVLGEAAPAETWSPSVDTAELRIVSVLFCDLVGYTPRSERLDADEVRELLSGYFDVARDVISRHGGTIDKFIGDAVLAVWGMPAAHENDAERAVRAGLELVDAVGGLRRAPRRRRVGRSRRHRHRPGRGDGVGRRRNRGRRSGEHGGADPVDRRAGLCARGRHDERSDRFGDRLSRRRPARAEGQGRTGSGVVRRASHRRCAGGEPRLGPRSGDGRARP